MDEFKSSTQIDIIHKMSKASYFNTVKLIRLLVSFYMHTQSCFFVSYLEVFFEVNQIYIVIITVLW